MSSEEAEHSTDSPPSEEQKDTEVQEENIENAETTELSQSVEAETQNEEVEQQTEEGTGVQEDDGATDQADEEAESEGRRKLTVDDIKTAPMDFRFPTTNQARHCFTRYIEYHKCVNAKGEDDPECNKYARYYRSLCPGEWVEKWNEQRENGTFAGPL